MSVAIQLDNPPEFYTNLEQISGRVVLFLQRAEQVGSIVVKLEGEAITALANNNDGGRLPGAYPTSRREVPGHVSSENHKLLYKVQQVFPDDYYTSSSNPYGSFPLPSGKHEYPFKFKLPINNACSDVNAMASIGGLAGEGGYGTGPGIFGIGGIRVMDGSRQLFYRHVTQTLPPSLTGYPMEAEIRYYLKVTVQRPGFLKENWRQAIGLKFLPIEPPRPKATGNEAFARRPFTFTTKSASPQKISGFFSRRSDKSAEATGKSAEAISNGAPATLEASPAPSVELSARLPHPSILTCNSPVPLRLIAKKLVEHPDEVYLISFQMELIGYTMLRAGHLEGKKVNKWVVTSNPNICIPLNVTNAQVGQEVVLPDDLWKGKCLPLTTTPSFTTCNISRKYDLELKLGLSWGKPKPGSKQHVQTIYNPLHFKDIQVFSGITPPAALLEAARNPRPGRATIQTNPRLPPRVPSSSGFPPSSTPSTAQTQTQPRPQSDTRPPQPARPPQDPLYPPQLAPGQNAADDAPPSYDEAIAEELAGPFDGLQPRPAYSGVTNENEPSEMPRTKN